MKKWRKFTLRKWMVLALAVVGLAAPSSALASRDYKDNGPPVSVVKQAPQTRVVSNDDGLSIGDGRVIAGISAATLATLAGSVLLITRNRGRLAHS